MTLDAQASRPPGTRTAATGVGGIIMASVKRKSAGPGVGTAHLALSWVVGVLLSFYHVTPLDFSPERRAAAWTGHLDDCADRCADDQTIAIRTAYAEQRHRGRLLHGRRLQASRW